MSTPNATCCLPRLLAKIDHFNKGHRESNCRFIRRLTACMSSQTAKKINYTGAARKALETFCIVDGVPAQIVETQKLLEENELILSKGSKNITVDMLQRVDRNLTEINKHYANVSKIF